MKKEIKICLPLYKIVYSVFVVVVLSLIRGVGSTFEIGVALEPLLALLAAVFCTDTYVQEIVSKRSEVGRLYPMKNRMTSMLRRMAVQETYLLVLAVAGYGLFLILKKPVAFYGTRYGEWSLFGGYLAAIVVTLIFWGMLSHTLSCLFRTMWAGIAGCLIVWILTNSTAGERLFGKWNVFSYTFRNIEDSRDLGWLCGKLVCLVLCMVMAGMLPRIIKRRG